VLGETCAPPVDSTAYVRDSAIIGAFATDLQLSVTGTRLFAPVRGDASLTWADVAADTGVPSFSQPANARYPAFELDCGVRVEGRCDPEHHAGNDANEPGNTRNITMPGEPFGMAQSEDGTVITITHQTDTKTSLLSTGLVPGQPSVSPALQFVLDGLPQGGVGIAAIPHDPLAFPDCGSGADPSQCLPRPAFLQTSRATPEIDLLRYYSDEGYGTTSSSLYRPYIVRESFEAITANASGTDSRGIAIDPTPRLRCEASLAAKGAATPEALQACARLPARVFVANRSPESLLVGEVGEPQSNGDVMTYNPDALLIYKNVPLTVGPSHVYVAPIVDRSGNYALRVFIVCFDSASIIIYDPEAAEVENVIRMGPGPYAIAFDPFDLHDVAAGAFVKDDLTVKEPSGTPVKAYRFAYVASFTDSFVQIIDLDGSRADKSTFEQVVFTLGAPTQPVGTQ
jgi:hypothetical protein